MSCPARERIAAAAADEDPRAAAHAESCARCAELLADQREVRVLARSLPAPSLAPELRVLLGERVARDAAPITQAELAAVLAKLRPPELVGERRSEIAASVLAAADAGDRGEVIGDDFATVLPFARRRGTRVVVVATLAAAAAIAVVIAWSATRDRPQPSVASATPIATPIPNPTPNPRTNPSPSPSPNPITNPSPSPSPSPNPNPNPNPSPNPSPPPTPKLIATTPHAESPTPALTPLPSAAIVAIGADYTRNNDAIVLRDGVLDVDARGHNPVAVAVGTTTFTVKEAHVELVAANGAIVSAHAFAGSVERTSGGENQVIAAGDIWTPPAGKATSLAAFRAGWQALHTGRTAAALAAFDLATDPVIAEDAAFWAAIAAQRLDDRDGARRRFRAFLGAFPASPRADSARRALAQLDQ